VTEVLELTATFVRLSDGGGAGPLHPTPSFWRGGAAADDCDRVLGAFAFRTPQDLHAEMQEMHPEVDEVLVLLSGAVDVLIESASEERCVALGPGQAAIVPRGVWHRLVVRQPGTLLFLNNRRGIRSRPRRGDR
jgi:mannose-6-phosphate isomerase-like protein (cupin superfamily)